MRFYDGCPDNELKAILVFRRKLLLQLPEGSTCVYFPVEHQYQVWSSYKPLSDMFDTPEAAMAQTIERLS